MQWLVLNIQIERQVTTATGQDGFTSCSNADVGDNILH